MQTMCNTHTSDVEASVAQCLRLHETGAQLIRLTVPYLGQVENLKEIKERLRAAGVDTPLVADVHFSSEIAIAAASVVEKVRINPGNFHKDHEKAREQFARLVEVCKENGTSISIGLNHGSLGDRITNLYGNTPLAMKEAVMEWLQMCVENDFYNVVVSLKASNTFVMVEAYRLLAKQMQETGVVFPLHLGVTEAGNGDGGRIKSAVGISALLSEGIGKTLRVSLTEDPACEIPVAQYMADRYDHRLHSTMSSLTLEGKKAIATYYAPSRERLLLDFSCDFGKRLLDKELDEVELRGTFVDENSNEVTLDGSEYAEYLVDELMQAARRRFYRPGAVGMSHHRKAFLMGNMHQLSDLCAGQAFLRQHPKAVKIHEAGDHDLDKIAALCPGLLHKLSEFFEIFIGFSDKGTVMPFFAQIGQGRTVGNAVIRRQFPRPFAGVPAIAAVPQVAVACIPVALQHPMDKGLVRPLAVPADGAFPVLPIQNHMHMYVAAHNCLLFAHDFCQIFSSTRAMITAPKASHWRFASRSRKKITPLRVTTSMVATL